MPDARLLSEACWNQLQDAAERYERDCADSFPRDISSYLPKSQDPIYLLLLEELIRIDLEIRWRNGKGAKLESYIEQFPDLVKDESRLVGLLEEELRVRRQFGDRPTLSEYKERFPGLQSRIDRLQSNDSGEFHTLESAVEIPFASAGNLKKVRRLGEGGFGEVWECRAPGGVPVAVKRIFGTVSPKIVEREKQSLDLICSGKFRHPFLLQVFGWWVQDNLLHIVMELADESLDDRLKAAKAAGKPGLSVDELRRVMRDAADALDFLNHECEILHRDVKPANMLLMAGRLKLCDFGLSRMTENLALGTGKTMGAGTPVFMAPEIIQGYQSMQSDQYSLAVSYCVLRSGHPLFRGSVEQIRKQHVNAVPSFEDAIFNSAEKRVLFKALAKDPKDRYPSTTEFVDELLAAVNTAKPVPATVTAPLAPSHEGPAPPTEPDVSDTDPKASAMEQTVPVSPKTQATWTPLKRHHTGRLLPTPHGLPKRKLVSHGWRNVALFAAILVGGILLGWLSVWLFWTR